MPQNFDYTGLLSGGVQGLIGLAGTGIQYALNKKLAEQQNQFNIDMWKMQADYNSPQSQMQRFSDAGLNPNLIYGQGSTGNMSSPPELQTPQSPDIQGAASDIAKAFNIQTLMLNDLRIKEAKEDARIKELERFDIEDRRQAETDFGYYYHYDMNSGRYVYEIPDSNSVVVEASNPRGHRTGDRPTNLYYYNRILAQHDPKAFMYSTQRRYLYPQIWMANYDKEHYPITYWIGQGGKIAKGLGEITSMFNPSRYFMPLRRGGQFMAPNGRVYNY